MKPAQSTIGGTQGLLTQLSQHPALPMLVGSPRIPLRLPPGVAAGIGTPKRLSAYLFFLMIDGASRHNVDLEEIRLGNSQVLFVRPYQVHQVLSDWATAEDWYKIAFDECCLGFLPQSFDFLINPLNNPVVTLTSQDQERLTHTFAALEQLMVSRRPHSTDLVLAHLNVLLTELNDSYFRNAQATGPNSGAAMEVYLEFKKAIEKEFRSQPSIGSIARSLCVSENRLYSIVTQFAGVSPKTFLLDRTILEARRIFYYDHAPVKEVAYELGFSDPDHFSRLFRKHTGKTPTQFLKELPDLYGK